MEKRLISRDNGWLCDLAFVYCMGKTFLFRMFFGWRRSDEKGCTFILSKRAWCELEEFIKEHYTG
jgi:hypothetical protein